jgi:hypothetical protein
MSLDPITAVLDIGGKLIDKLIPDPAARDAAKLELLKQQQAGNLEEIKVGLSAIISDSQSADKWTSRARPTFLYVVYIMILASIPMGFVYAINPHTASDITVGFQAWLKAIPDPFLQLFGVVMTGYIAGRSWEKVKGAA